MEILAIGFLTFVAAGVGTLTGFGTSTMMIPLLVMIRPPVEAIFLVAIIHWFGNIWKIALFYKGFNLRLVVLFGVAGLAASYVGAFISLGAQEERLLRLLGLFLAGYAGFLLLRTKFAVPAGNLAALVGGVASGFFAGMFGLGGAIRSMFLAAYNLPPAVYIATAGAIGLMVDATRIITYATGGVTLPADLWFGLMLFIPLSFLGARLAKRIVDHIPQTTFRTLIAGFLGAMGLKLILWP